MNALYDRIGTRYFGTRREDPRIAGVIASALGDSASILNVGAGTGSYEPIDRNVIAVEPSETMISQRPTHSAPVVRATAESLPFSDNSFDAALAVNTVHHWSDVRAGIRELSRIARDRIVIFLRDTAAGTPFWLTQEYFPSLDASLRHSEDVHLIQSELRTVKAIPVELPFDCSDGLFSAYWGRPEMYLVAEIRRNISNFAMANDDVVEIGLAKLRADLDSGVWDRTHGRLRSLKKLDLGHRILVAEYHESSAV